MIVRFELKAHAAVAAVLLKQASDADMDAEEFVSGVIRDLETSGLTEKEKALFRFVDIVNGCSTSITPRDIETLHDVGWDDDAIYYAITVCALFNFYNRWMDASGVHALSDEAHRQNAKRSASYRVCQEIVRRRRPRAKLMRKCPNAPQ